MMIEMPPRELAGGDPARHRVQPSERAIQPRAPAREDGVMDDLVKENREVERGETLHDGEGQPEEHVGGGEKAPGRECQDRELARRDGKVMYGALLVKSAERVTRQRRSQFRPQRGRVLAVKVALHVSYDDCTGRGGP